jgi:hypothetical protein
MQTLVDVRIESFSAFASDGHAVARLLFLREQTSTDHLARTSFHHQPEAQHQKSSAIHKLQADYPIFALKRPKRCAARTT